MEQTNETGTKPAGAESCLTAGLGLIARLREWSKWSESQGEDDLANLLCNAANEIERLERIEVSALRVALILALEVPNVELTGRAKTSEIK